MRTFTSSSSSKRLVRSALSLLLVVLSLISATTSAFATEVSMEEISVASATGVLTLGPNYIGQVTFTGSNGGNYRTLPPFARQMRIRLYHKDVDNLGVYGLTVYVYKCIDANHEECVYQKSVFSGNTGGPYELVSDKFYVTPGADYRLVYRAKNQGGYNEDRRVTIDVYWDIYM